MFDLLEKWRWKSNDRPFCVLLNTVAIRTIRVSSPVIRVVVLSFFSPVSNRGDGSVEMTCLYTRPIILFLSFHVRLQCLVVVLLVVRRHFDHINPKISPDRPLLDRQEGFSDICSIDCSSWREDSIIRNSNFVQDIFNDIANPESLLPSQRSTIIDLFFIETNEITRWIEQIDRFSSSGKTTIFGSWFWNIQVDLPPIVKPVLNMFNIIRSLPKLIIRPTSRSM